MVDTIIMGRVYQILTTLLLLSVVYRAQAGKDRATGDTPCAEISLLYKRWAADGGDGNFEGIPGEKALGCLRSMPFRPDLALRFIDEYLGYLQFHSTLEMLKDPPRSYISSSVDLLGGFEKIRSKVTRGRYTSQFDFDQDINSVLGAAHDGHLQLGLCSQEIFHFFNRVPLVSASVDSLQIPRIYTSSDAERLLNGFRDVSHVVEIDNVDAVYYLEAHPAMNLAYQDPDARYNQLFPSAATNFTGFYSGGSWTTHKGRWPGAATRTLRFANDTELEVETMAFWPASNGPMIYESGRDLFEVACLPNGLPPVLGTFPGRFPAPSRPSYRVPPSGPLAYPSPVSRHKHDYIRGYYVDVGLPNDVAVLQVPTFSSGEQSAEFSQTAVDFVKQAGADGIRKIIIDLSANAGGDLVPGYNLFKVFFPDRPIYSATRFRCTELVRLMGKVFSHVYGAEAPLDPPLVYQAARDSETGEVFRSWDHLFGPHGANMSSEYAAFDFDRASTATDPISGYGAMPLDPPFRTFQPEDMVLVTDGRCSSTCTVFAELMKREGVRSVALGGRPRHGPMQALGGVRGAQRWSLDTAHRHASRAYALALALASNATTPILSPDELARFRQLMPPRTRDFSLRTNIYGESDVNFRNAYGRGDDDRAAVPLPLQFAYDAADCRLFYTLENYFRPVTTWVAVAGAMFGNGSCVEGSRTTMAFLG
ncbi:peptidase S41 family protein [Xylariaceae sp. FL0594]|nr:peptidase S41 family protein [Xylariaceae sp. FL0594]